MTRGKETGGLHCEDTGVSGAFGGTVTTFTFMNHFRLTHSKGSPRALIRNNINSVL